MYNGLLMKVFTLTLLAILLGTSPKASAGVIARDFATPGDGLLTYDTVNRREWLDLPETAGAPLAEVMSQMAPGGRLEGFKFAKLADVSDLAASAGVGWTTWTITFDSQPQAPQLVELLGAVVTYSGGVSPDIDIALGLIATDSSASVPTFDDTIFLVVSMVVEEVVFGQNGASLIRTPRGGVLTSGPSPPAPGQPAIAIGNVGPFWLYRAVPEPVGLSLGASALIGPFFARRRRTRTA
jgi:hypothetical protein